TSCRRWVEKVCSARSRRRLGKETQGSTELLSRVRSQTPAQFAATPAAHPSIEWCCCRDPNNAGRRHVPEVNPWRHPSKRDVVIHWPVAVTSLFVGTFDDLKGEFFKLALKRIELENKHVPRLWLVVVEVLRYVVGLKKGVRSHFRTSGVLNN